MGLVVDEDGLRAGPAAGDDARGATMTRWALAAVLAPAAFGLGWAAGSSAITGAIAVAALGGLALVGLLVAAVSGQRKPDDRFARYFDQSLDLLATANFDGYFEHINPAWERALGYARTELLERPYLEFVHRDDRKRTRAAATRLAQPGAGPIKFHNRYRAADGTFRWLEWSAHSVHEEGRIYAAARDITAQRQSEEALENHSKVLEATVRERTRALEEARLETLERLALAAEYRDEDTQQHNERVGRTAALIGRQLRLPDETVALLRRAAPLHDIGKLGVPDSILLKPGKLTRREIEEMQQHVTIGARILGGPKSAVLQMAEEIALTHHERWDGKGYVDGMRERKIPLSGRITAVADVFDALTHERPYKAAWTISKAVAEIRRHSGAQFDPRVVEAFAALDHQTLLAPIESFDIELAPPPPESERNGRHEAKVRAHASA